MATPNWLESREEDKKRPKGVSTVGQAHNEHASRTAIAQCQEDEEPHHRQPEGSTVCLNLHSRYWKGVQRETARRSWLVILIICK